MQIRFREYKKQDFKALECVIRKTWHYDEFCTPKTAKKLARVFLSSCLTNGTFSQVAEIDGTAAGIILVKDEAVHRCPFRRRLRQMSAIASLYLSKEGRKAFRIFGSVSGIDKELLAECEKAYPAELALFAVDASYRGKGIGKKLFQSALAYLEERRLEEFYLFTDTSCNFGFYEHQGMVRRCEREHVFRIEGQTARMSFFIYDYDRSRTAATV